VRLRVVVRRVRRGGWPTQAGAAPGRRGRRGNAAFLGRAVQRERRHPPAARRRPRRRFHAAALQHEADVREHRCNPLRRVAAAPARDHQSGVGRRGRAHAAVSAGDRWPAGGRDGGRHRPRRAGGIRPHHDGQGRPGRPAGAAPRAGARAPTRRRSRRGHRPVRAIAARPPVAGLHHGGRRAGAGDAGGRAGGRSGRRPRAATLRRIRAGPGYQRHSTRARRRQPVFRQRGQARSRIRSRATALADVPGVGQRHARAERDRADVRLEHQPRRTPVRARRAGLRLPARGMAQLRAAVATAAAAGRHRRPGAVAQLSGRSGPAATADPAGRPGPCPA
jgi:hypothetical protein